MENNEKPPIKIDGITPEMAKKMLEANSKAMVSKLSKGSTLSKGDILKLEKIVLMGESEKYLREGAKTWIELAAALGVSRRTLQNWRNKGNCPKQKKDGTHDVEAWLNFMDAEKSDPGIKKLNEARLRILNIEAEDKKHKLDVRKGKYVALTEIRETWTAHIQKAKALMCSKFENELPPIYTLNPVDNMKLNKEAIEEICSILSDGGTCTP